MRFTLAITWAVFLLVGCESQSKTAPTQPKASTQPGASTQPDARPVAGRAEDVQPLKPGDRAPGGELRTADGQRVSLSTLYSKQPAMLIFYRGGW